MTIFHGRLEPDRGSLAAIGRNRVLAFAGIGNPEKFFATLSEAGIEVAERAEFPDHHRYSAAEAQDLIARAEAARLMMLTTEKDWFVFPAIRRSRRSLHAPARFRCAS